MNYQLTHVRYKGRVRLLIGLPGETWPEMLGEEEDLSDPLFFSLIQATQPEFMGRVAELLKLWDDIDRVEDEFIDTAYQAVISQQEQEKV